MSDETARQQAKILFDQAYRLQMRGELAHAINLYKRAINIFPTAEAYTFLGWTYGMLKRFDEAIDMCHQAIATDPTFGNPYNDIGAYLIEQKKWKEAIPWLEKAIEAPRYDARQYPYMNLGRVYEHLGQYHTALTCYDNALAIHPFYLSARWAKYALLGKMN
ncbi:MAG: tetratricopeptide repeat protein [Ardenticatenaceae bacterium]|nr:tetratricopeptide repeat protein [Ardenticatenaceae bacterium]MCB9444783.1 tetratricopeptide repeat protein [Ardenticatenaceae bacterium]